MWLDEIENITNWARDREVAELPPLKLDLRDRERMARVLREQSAVLTKTNPWSIDNISPNIYCCRYCYAHIKATRPPKNLDRLEEHAEYCVWLLLSDDAKELLG